MVTTALLAALRIGESSLLDTRHGVLLLRLLGDYGLPILTAYNSTTVTPRPKVTMEH